MTMTRSALAGQREHVSHSYTCGSPLPSKSFGSGLRVDSGMNSTTGGRSSNMRTLRRIGTGLVNPRSSVSSIR